MPMKQTGVTIDPASGLVHDARQVPSPNCDDWPAACVPELIVIHGISLPPGEFGGPWIERLFTNTLDGAADPSFAEIASLRVSSHLLIRRDGELLQFVPLTKRAWHAGESSFCGRNRCNDFSIGIEMEGTDQTPYTEAQYQQLVSVVMALRSALPSLAMAPLVGHSDIAPDRKTDPGPAFDWGRLAGLMAGSSRA
jgi:AmpD protein